MAAIQVLLLHCFTAFFPNLVTKLPSSGTIGGYIHASPLFIFYDGSSAVYIFFTLSGYVLTRAFMHSQAPFPDLVLGRALRLGLPSIAACLLSAVLFMLFGEYVVRAVEVIGSVEALQKWHPSLDTWFITDGLINAVVIGYRESSLLGLLGFPKSLQPSLLTAYVQPLWTLSVEFYGSLLIFALLRMRPRRSTGLQVGVAGLALLLCRTSLVCFLIGYFAAIVRADAFRGRRANACALALIVAGLCLTFGSQFWQFAPVERLCALPQSVLLPCYVNAAFTTRTIGGSLITVGIIALEPARNFLSRRSFRQLGRLSFPIYLVHWPVIYGIGMFVVVEASPVIGPLGGRLAGLISALSVTVIFAQVFTRVDAIALMVSRLVRQRQLQHHGSSRVQGIVARSG